MRGEEDEHPASKRAKESVSQGDYFSPRLNGSFKEDVASIVTYRAEL